MTVSIEKQIYTYAGEFGSLEVNLEENSVKDAIQWPLVAKKSNYKADEFIKFTRKIFNEAFTDGNVDFDFKNKSLLEFEVERYLDPEKEAGAIDLELIVDHGRDNRVLHIHFDNKSHLE